MYSYILIRFPLNEYLSKVSAFVVALGMRPAENCHPRIPAGCCAMGDLRDGWQQGACETQAGAWGRRRGRRLNQF